MISVHLILIPVDSGGFRLIPVFRRTRPIIIFTTRQTCTWGPADIVPLC